MKKFAVSAAMSLAMLVLGTLVVPPQASAQVCVTGSVLAQRPGPEVPLPLGSALPFPWKDMDGYWQVKGPDDRLFVMKSLKTDRGDHVLKIVEFDPITGKEIARGLATPVDSSQVVRAQMLGKGSDYELYVGSYPELTKPYEPTRSVVFAVRSLGFDNLRAQKLVARKLANLRFN